MSAHTAALRRSLWGLGITLAFGLHVSAWATSAAPRDDASFMQAVEALEALHLEVHTQPPPPPQLRRPSDRRQCCGRPHASARLMRPQRLLRGNPGNAARIPADILAAFGGREVHSFAHFRRLFWQAVAASRYADELGPINQTLMRLGHAPTVPQGQRVGRRRTYELHHVVPIARGGALYDLSNLMIVTPLYHVSVLSPRYHFGRPPCSDEPE